MGTIGIAMPDIACEIELHKRYINIKADGRVFGHRLQVGPVHHFTDGGGLISKSAIPLVFPQQGGRTSQEYHCNRFH